MTIELYYSNQINVLFECLNINLQSSYQYFKDPFQPDNVIVLNAHTRKWLQLNLASKNGVMANIDFPFLEGVLWELLKKLDSNPAETDFLNKEKLRIVLFELFLTKQHPDLEIFEKYLNQSSSEKMHWARTWMLAEKIASLLMEYEYQRHEMIDAWLDNRLYLKKDFEEIEKAQKYLYLFLLHPKTGLLQKREKPLLSLYLYAKKVFSNPLKKVENEKPIHLFAISQVSVFHQQLLMRLKDHFDFHIYAFNPCREFWDDIKTTSEDRMKRSHRKTLELKKSELEEGELIKPENDHYLLKNWGKTGREYIKLMSSLVDYNFYSGFIKSGIPHEDETVLQRINRHILDRSNGANEKKLEQDRSLQIFKAPSITREVQTVYHSILNNLKENPLLKLHEIAVLVPNMDLYRTSITSVFEGSAIPMKYGITDNAAINDSVWAKGLLSILEIAKGMITREEIFCYLSNPCAMCKFDFSEIQLKKWENWVSKLNIFHHLDDIDKLKDGFSESLFFTWKQGLQRIRMGRLFSANHQKADHGYPYYIPEYLNGDDDDIDKFILVIEKLSKIISELRLLHSTEGWVDLIRKISREFLQVPEEIKDEKRYIPGLIKHIESLHDFEIAAKELNSKPHLNLNMIYEILVSALAVSDSIKGGFLNGGVVVSELQPMRPFPFKITYILGLGGADFPGRDVTFPLDLRQFKRKIGDIANSDRNRYLFLENFLSTTEKIYLSWVSRNLIKDEDLAPSSIILQLKRYLETEIILSKQNESNKSVGFQIFEIPLQSFHLPKMLDKNNHATDLFKSFSVSDHINAHIENRSELIKNPEDFKTKYPITQKYFPEIEIKSQKEIKPPDIYKLKAYDLIKYLQFSSYAYMGYQLGIQESAFEEDEPLKETLEPLDLDNLQINQIKKTVSFEFYDLAKSSKTTKDFTSFAREKYGKLHDKLMKECKSGENGFSDYIAKNMENSIISGSEYYQFIANDIKAADHFFHSLHYGSKLNKSSKLSSYNSVSSALKIESDKFKAVIEIDIQICWIKENQFFYTIDKPLDKLQGQNYRDLIKVLLIYAFSDNPMIEACQKLIVYPNSNKFVVCSIDKNKIREYFYQLIENFLFGKNQILFPENLVTCLEDFSALPSKECQEKTQEYFDDKSKGEYGFDLPNYLTIDKFKIPEDIGRIYLLKFTYTSFFEVCKTS